MSFKDDWKEKLSHIKSFLTSEEKWDILRLGCSLTSLHRESIQSNIWLCKAWNTEALIYNKNKSLLKMLEKNQNEHIDVFIHDSDLLDFSLLDSMCYQRSEGTNNQWDNNLFSNFIQKH